VPPGALGWDAAESTPASRGGLQNTQTHYGKHTSDENGDPVEVCRVLEIRTDEHGTQHTERTEYDRGEGPDP